MTKTWSEALETIWRVWLALDKLDDEGRLETSEANDLRDEGEVANALSAAEWKEFDRRVDAHLDARGKKD